MRIIIVFHSIRYEHEYEHELKRTSKSSWLHPATTTKMTTVVKMQYKCQEVSRAEWAAKVTVTLAVEG